MILFIVLYVMQMTLVLAMVPVMRKVTHFLWAAFLAYGYPDIGFSGTYAYTQGIVNENIYKKLLVTTISIILSGVFVAVSSGVLPCMIMSH